MKSPIEKNGSLRPSRETLIRSIDLLTIFAGHRQTRDLSALLAGFSRKPSTNRFNLAVLGRMDRNFEDEIAALEAEIAKADMVKAMFVQLWEFSKRLLVDRAIAWEQANIDQK